MKISRAWLAGLVLISAIPTAVAGCAPAGSSESEATAEAVEAFTLPDACMTVSPDVTYAATSSGTSTSFHSPSDSYAWRSTGCNWYVVDVSMTASSASLTVDTGGYDVPNSSAAEPGLPNNAYDCANFTTRLHVYSKQSGASSFTLTTDETRHHQWVNGACQPTQPAPYVVLATSGSGTDVYRIATWGKIRGIITQTNTSLSHEPS